MKSLKSLLTVAVPCLFLFAMLFRPQAALEGAQSGLVLWAGSVLPAVYPFLVGASLFVAAGTPQKIGNILHIPGKALFRLGPAASGSMLLGWVCGAPGGPRAYREMYDRGEISRGELCRLCSVANGASPLFLLGAVGVALLNSAALGALLLGVQTLSMLLNGLLWRPLGDGTIILRAKKATSDATLFSHLPSAIRDSCLAMLAIGGAIALFSTLASLISAYGVLATIENALSALLPAPVVRAMLTGALELTMGCNEAARLIDMRLTAALCAGICSFGGLSVAIQSYLFIKDVMPLSVYLLQRLSQGIIAFFLALVATRAFPETLAQAFAPLTIATAAAASPVGPALLCLGALLLVALGCAAWAQRTR